MIINQFHVQQIQSICAMHLRHFFFMEQLTLCACFAIFAFFFTVILLLCLVLFCVSNFSIVMCVEKQAKATYLEKKDSCNHIGIFMRELTEQESALFDALDEEDIETVKTLLNQGVDPDCRDEVYHASHIHTCNNSRKTS